MSVYQEKRGLNWGGALMTLGQGLGQYAQEKQRLEDEKRKREQEQADLNAANILAEQIRTEQYGPVIPAPVPSDIDYNAPGIGMYSTGATTPAQNTFDYAGVSLPREQFAGQRANPALDSWLQAHPITKPSDQKLFTWTDPVTGTQVTTTYEDYLQYTRPKTPGAGEQMVPFTYPNADWVSPEIRGATINVPYPQYASLTNEFYGRFNEAGKSGSSPAQVAKATTQITNDLLGNPIQRLSKDGALIDTRTGGTAVSGLDFSNLVSPELGRGVHQAVQDSLETGRWPLNSPADVLGANVLRDVGSQYIDLALPAGASFDGGKPNDPTDDRFLVPSAARLFQPDNLPNWVPGKKTTQKMRPIEFAKEYLIPQINDAKDAGLGWQAMVKAANTYGLDIEQLKGLLDKKKFAAYLATAAETPTATPTPKSAAKPAQRKTINGVTYVNKTGNPNDWETE